MNPMSGFDIRLVFTLAPRDNTKDAYTSEITFLALHPCSKGGISRYPLEAFCLIKYELWFLYNTDLCNFTAGIHQYKTILNLEKRRHHTHYLSDRGFKGSVVNRTLASLTTAGANFETSNLDFIYSVSFFYFNEWGGD